MAEMTRRGWLGTAATGALTAGVLGGTEAVGSTCTLSIGTYGTQGMPLPEAIELVARTGFDGIEIAVQPGHSGDPAHLSPPVRSTFRRLLVDHGLKLTSLMENLHPARDDQQHAADMDRLRRVMELAHDLAPDDPPLIQTVLGGGTWAETKDLFRDRLGDWLQVAQNAGIVLAIKPHRGGAMSRPSEAIWLIEQLGNPPRLRMVYDHSHYAFRDMPLDQTVRSSLAYTAHVALKDAVRKDPKVVFLLPGASGTFDYPRLLRIFYEGGYRGDFCCEVSSMVWGQPGYDPAQAVLTCYANMARAFADAGVPRRRSGPR